MCSHIAYQRVSDLSLGETPFPADALKLIVVIATEDRLQWKIVSLLEDRNVTVRLRSTGRFINS